jgi:hypothetical protein
MDRFNEDIGFCLYFQTQIVCHPRIGPRPFFIAVWPNLAPDLPRLRWDARSSQLGAALKVVCTIRVHPVSGTLGVIAARFLVQIGAPTKKAAGPQKRFFLSMVKPALAAGRRCLNGPKGWRRT